MIRYHFAIETETYARPHASPGNLGGSFANPAKMLKMRKTRRLTPAIFLTLILFPAVAAPASPAGDADLWARYHTYKKGFEQRHWVDGLVANACVDKPGGKPTEHHFGDSALWTGVWLATLSLDYHRRPRASTLARIRETLEALERLEVVSGYLVRTDRGPEAGTWLAKPSAGQYMGVLLGYDFAYRFADRPDVRERIRRQTRNIAAHLQQNAFFIMDPFGKPTPRGPSGVAFEFPWRKIFLRIAKGDFPAGKVNPAGLLSLNLDVAFGLILKLMEPRKRYLFSLNNAHRLYSRLPRQYSNLHLLFLSSLALMDENESGEEDPEFNAAFRRLYESVARDDPENPLFASIADLILGTEQSAALTRRVLRQFPDTLPNNWDDSRFHQDNAWQRNPRQRQIAYDVPRSDGKGNCTYSEYPGLDFMLPWMLDDFLSRRKTTGKTSDGRR